MGSSFGTNCGDNVAYLPAVPLAPSENTALTVAASHQPFYLLAIQALGPHAVLQAGAVVVLKVDAMLVQKVQALLFVVCGSPSERGLGA